MCSRCSAAPRARSARPNVDERVSSGPAFDAFFNPIPGNFALKTQTSHDIEGGFRIKSGGFQMQSSIYNMDLENEIHFIPALFFNVNLDPTRRYGSETSASLRAQRQRAAARRRRLYPRGVSRRRRSPAMDVPLVSRYTASGGVTWNIWQKYLVADATVRAWSERFMDNDQANTQRPIPANATVDFKLSGEYEPLLLVAQRQQPAQRAVLRLRDRKHVHRRPLQRLSAAGPDLHGEGRRDVLTVLLPRPACGAR